MCAAGRSRRIMCRYGQISISRRPEVAARRTRAFSSEVESGSRQENASNQESRAPFRFDRNGALVVGPTRWAAMCMRFQRFQETSHLRGDELARRKQGVHAERLAEVVRHAQGASLGPVSRGTLMR